MVRGNNNYNDIPDQDTQLLYKRWDFYINDVQRQNSELIKIMTVMDIETGKVIEVLHLLKSFMLYVKPYINENVYLSDYNGKDKMDTKTINLFSQLTAMQKKMASKEIMTHIEKLESNSSYALPSSVVNEIESVRDIIRKTYNQVIKALSDNEILPKVLVRQKEEWETYSGRQHRELHKAVHDAIFKN